MTTTPDAPGPPAQAGADLTAHLDTSVFSTYLERTRWFGGKGRTYAVSAVRSVGVLPGGPPLVVIYLVELTYDDASGGVELYQVPLSFYEHPEHRLDHAFVGWWEDPEHGWVHAYDAVHDREAMALWQRAFAAMAPDDDPPGTPPPGGSGLVFHRLGRRDLDLEAHSTLFSGEQSNSSVAFGEDALMKVFRKVTPGVNPDVEIHAALTRAGVEEIADLYGWLDVTTSGQDGEAGQVLQLAMLQQFLRTASDGWDLALASVRSLFADPERHAFESGGDFAGEASRLGEALRTVHGVLHDRFEVTPASLDTGALAATMTARLDAALPAVPELVEHAETLRAVFARVADLGTVEVQRVHGDLHLGQTLRTSVGWKIVDFEGEPAKTLPERRLPDSPWRDVAGMLRSFDYAPRVVQRSLGTNDEHDASLIATRAEEWAQRNENHFLVAYAGGEIAERDRILLDAYVADKAVYETIYETRNRPSWVSIPLQAIARIGVA